MADVICRNNSMKIEYAFIQLPIEVARIGLVLGLIQYLKIFVKNGVYVTISGFRISYLIFVKAHYLTFPTCNDSTNARRSDLNRRRSISFSLEKV